MEETLLPPLLNIPNLQIMKQAFHTNGKLLLTGEYFVTEGSVALAVPTRLGQALNVSSEASAHPQLFWKSYDRERQLWFEACLDLRDWTWIQTTDEDMLDRLDQLLTEAQLLNPSFLTAKRRFLVETQLDFHREWGLGSSSTLVKMLAQWAQVDAYTLLASTFGGSGYDLAAATADGPLYYQLRNGQPLWEHAPFQPPFMQQLFLVYLEQKQNSREALARFRSAPRELREKSVRRISQLSFNCAQYIHDLPAFEEALREHEILVQEVIGQPRAKDLFFQDYWGEIKSLGAWGGDFVLATSQRSANETIAYFKAKGFQTTLPFERLALMGGAALSS